MKPNPHNMREEAMAAQMLLAALRESGTELDGEERDTLIEGQTSLKEAVSAAALSILLDEAHAKALGDTLDKLQARKARLEARAKRARGSILAAMEIVGERKLEAPAATVAVEKGRPSVVIVEETEIPLTFKKVEPEVDAARHALLRAATALTLLGRSDVADEMTKASDALCALYQPDKTTIKEAIDRGEPVSGALVSNGMPILKVYAR